MYKNTLILYKNKIKQQIRILFKRNSKLFFSLRKNQKLYYIGCISSILTFIFWLLPFDNNFVPILRLTVLIFFFAVISDLIVLHQKIWGTHIGKGIILGSYAFITNIGYAISEQIINEVIQYGYINLYYAKNFVIFLLIPMGLVMLMSIIFCLLFIFTSLFLTVIFFFKELKNSKLFNMFLSNSFEPIYPRLTMAIRFIIFSMVTIMCVTLIRNNNEAYAQFLKSTTESFIYTFEAQTYSRCVINKNEKAIHINDKELIVVKKEKNNYIFEPQLCKPRLINKTYNH